MNGYHVNLTSFVSETGAGVTMFSSSSGMLKFATNGLYQVTCVIVGDQALNKVAIGKTSTYTTWTALQAAGTVATSGYEYVYNMAVGSSPSTVITVPLLVSDTSQYYYFDVFLSTIAGAPTVLYPTRSTTAVGTNYGTYIQVMPFGSYVSSATSPSAGLLMTSTGTTLSAPRSSNTYRIAMTTANNWTVNGTSTAISITSGGNFQVNQAGIYEVSLCVNADSTPVQFGLGSLGSDTTPSGIGPYLYQYAPMYTQDPSTVISLPLNITSVSSYYYIDVTFPLTTSTVSVSSTSTYVMIRPIGTYLPPTNQVWSIQGSTAYYNGGNVGIGVNPSLTTETLTVSGNTSFVGNVTVTSDVAGSTYVNARRVPAGSLDVTKYVTGSVPLTTTTNLIQNYLSNAATITANTSTGTITQALYIPGTTTSSVNFSTGQSICLSNLALSNIFLETWVYVSLGASQCVFTRQVPGSNTQFSMFIDASGIVTTNFANATVTVSASNVTPITGSAWWHLAASYQRLTNTTGTVRLYINGGKSTDVSFGSATGTQPLIVPGTTAFYIGNAPNGGAALNGNVADVRVMTNCIVPIATFTAQAAPFTTAPTYRTGMDTGYTSNLTLALQSQYFPGASTSPYGPVLTLPGTVGSYYAANVTALDTTISTTGFTVEAWVNFASLANSAGGPNGSPATSYYPYMLSKIQPFGGVGDWFWGVNPVGAVHFYTGVGRLATANNVVTTGQWTHVMAQCNGSNLYMAVNGTFQTLTGTGGSTPAGGNNTIAPSTPSVGGTSGIPLTLGQYNSAAGPNYAIAKARIVLGTTGANGNVYSSGNFTANPNFAPVPAGATVAWQLDSQFPQPTYPSFFDVPQLPQQIAAYGAEPVPVGGVTSNVLGPYSTTYPQLDSIRFDGTGYIDYGASASSVLTANLWASPWTIEGWVYLPSTLGAGQSPGILSRSSPSGSSTLVDWSLYLGNNPANLLFSYGSGGLVYNYNLSTTIPTATWTHVAATYDGTRSNVYVNGALSNSMVATTTAMSFNPTYGTVAGAYNYGLYLASENLADLRVSNVARYTGSSYVVPTSPFTTDSATLLLLRSLGGQVGTTLEVQGRGLGSTSIGATQTVRAYPPAPMSSYMLDTTSNSSVTYGQGKYVASASSEYVNYSTWAWYLFDNNAYSAWASSFPGGTYNGTPPYAYTGSVVTVDVLGNSYPGEWAQLQMPVSVILSSYTLTPDPSQNNKFASKFYILGSRDGINWTLVNSQSGINWSASVQTFAVGATQGYNYYRMVINQVNGSGGVIDIGGLLFYGLEESLCVTSDSKVGVGIANPQRALEVAGDLVVGGTISGGYGMGMFRNRIINGDMRIAQRGTSNVLPYVNATYTYLIDRLAIQIAGPPTSGVITQYQTALGAAETPYQLGLRNYANVVVSVGFNGTAANPVQIIEGYNIQDFNWGTSFAIPVTLSFWFRSNAPIGSMFSYSLVNYGYGSASYAGTFTIASSGTWQYYTFTVPPPPNGSTWGSGTNGGIIVMIAPYYIGGYTSTVNAWNSGSYTYFPYGGYPWPTVTGTYVHFTGVQLEKGTVATPFEFRPYATELALCQRYFTQLGGQMTFNYFGTGVASSSSGAYILCPLNVPMRLPSASTVSVLNVGSIKLLGNVSGVYGSTILSAIAKDQHNVNNIELIVTSSSANLTVNFPYMLYTDNSLAALIQINNEL
jgi:hypothetical protein